MVATVDLESIGDRESDSHNAVLQKQWHSRIFGAVLAQVMSKPSYIDNQSQPQIVRYDFDTDHLPNYYKYNYATSDGASRSEEGTILNPDTKEAALDVKGAVRWYDDKGKLFEMTYKAGKRGYRTIIRRIYS